MFRSETTGTGIGPRPFSITARAPLAKWNNGALVTQATLTIWRISLWITRALLLFFG
jgi:hypothetical protein